MIGESEFRKRFLITIIIAIILLSIFVWFIPVSSTVMGDIRCRAIDLSGEFYYPHMEDNVDFSCGIHVWTDYYNEDTIMVIDIVVDNNPNEIIYTTQSSNVKHDESIKMRYDNFVWAWAYIDHPDLEDGNYTVILYLDFGDGYKSGKTYDSMIVKNGISLNDYGVG